MATISVPAVSVPAPNGLRVAGFGARALRFWRRHLLLGNVVLCGAVWMLYGELQVRGYGGAYFRRAQDLWLSEGWPGGPGIENVLLPGIAAAFAQLWTAAGFVFTEHTFIIVAAIPYALFIYGLTVHVGRSRPGGPLLAVAAALTLYSSGLVPYMTTWGGSVDGFTYLGLLPVIMRPDSFVVFIIVAVLQCSNHYAGVLSLVLFAFLWHTFRALDRADRRDALKYWLSTVAPRAVVCLLLLWAFTSFWHTRFPDAAGVRGAVVAENWATAQQATRVVQEVLGPFPWTLLSTLKLAVVPIVVLMWAPWTHRRLRALTLAVPFATAMVLTLVFVDVTRVAMMLVIPAWLVMLSAAGGEFGLPPKWRHRFRRLVIAMALLNVLIPNYYVNNGAVIIPPARPIQALISMIIEH